MKPFEGYIDLEAADDKSGAHVVMKTTRYNNEPVDITLKQDFINKPVNVPFDIWFRELKLSLQEVMKP